MVKEVWIVTHEEHDICAVCCGWHLVRDGIYVDFKIAIRKYDENVERFRKEKEYIRNPKIERVDISFE
jgi:Ethanolamine utilization protein EutJ (predicted chaperonin)